MAYSHPDEEAQMPAEAVHTSGEARRSLLLDRERSKETSEESEEEMNLIDRDQLLDLISRFAPECYRAVNKLISQLPPLEPTLYGYKLNHLAFVAALLQNKGVTEENLADVLNSVDWIVGMVLEEQRKTMDEALKKVEVKYDEND